jgi:hypothetical protein
VRTVLVDGQVAVGERVTTVDERKVYDSVAAIAECLRGAHRRMDAGGPSRAGLVPLVPASPRAAADPAARLARGR